MSEGLFYLKNLLQPTGKAVRRRPFLYRYNISKYTHVEIRYAIADITQAKEMTFDFTLDSLSKTAMEVIQDMTRVMSAMTVILLMMPAQLLSRKHSRAITITVIRYLSHPPLLKMTGISKAAQIMPSNRHFKISIIRLSIYFLLPFFVCRIATVYNKKTMF